MKKWIAMVLSVLMMFTLAACGNTQNESDRTTSGSTAQSQETEPTQKPESSTQPEEESSNKNTEGNAESTGEKTLVVYFSMPETADSDNMTEEEDNSVVVIDGEVLGNTQYVAYVIQENTGADIFRIEPETPYPTDHDTLVDLAAEEQDNNARPALKSIIENLDQYDTIFVGYPKMEYGFNCVSCI